MVYSSSNTVVVQHLFSKDPKAKKLKTVKSFVHIYGKGWLIWEPR